MKATHPIPIHTKLKHGPYYHTLHISQDLLIAKSDDESLFKLPGTDEVVWIPNEMINDHSTKFGTVEIAFSDQDLFSCAKMVVSNFIRMCLVKQHQVPGQQIINHFKLI